MISESRNIRLGGVGLCALFALAAVIVLPARACAVAVPGAAPEKYAVESFSAQLSTTQAGAHPDFTTTFRLTSEDGQPYATTRDVRFQLPPGLIGNPQPPIPACTGQQFGTAVATTECPQDSQVGITAITLGGKNAGTFSEPIYNMTSPGGDIVARLGFYAAIYPTIINIRVDPVDYGLVATIEGASATAALLAANSTLWGIPASSVHDLERITPEEALNNSRPPGGRKSGLPDTPFMTNPTSCGTPRQITVTATSYQLPDAPSSATAPFPQITGCGKLAFDPIFTLTPTNAEAAAPTGLDVALSVPQDETASSLAASTLKSAIVTLPEGMTINPAAGDGLGSCSAVEVAFEQNEDAHCPDAAKLGEVEVAVPALAHPLQGSIYQRTPEPGRLFRLWVVADELGVHLKLPAEIEPNPVNGQIQTLFLGVPALGGNPQVPFSDFKLHFSGGPRAPLSTPARCGTYQTHYEFTPWSGTPPVVGETAMQITSGCGKGGFAPQLSAGTLNPSAAGYSPFLMRLTRSDGEANPQTLEVSLPQGLIAKLAGVAVCPDSAAASGACPAASQVGSVQVATGVGSAPLWVPQPGRAPTAIYLAGPYKGGPYSLVIKVPAQAGPFDLGTVVTRAAIYVNSSTTQVSVVSDPLPQILEGVPIAYRDIRVSVDRPEFTLNPTNCNLAKVTARVTAVGGAVANPTAAYQATDCANLAFKPTLKLSFSGQTKRTGNPAVKAVLTQPKGRNANLAGAAVVLPKGMFVAQAHVNNPCTRVQFSSTPVPGGGCPAKSILGTAKVWTPLLERPEEGNVYFRSNGGERELPDLVLALQGQIPVQLVGFIDSVGKKGAEVRRVRTRFQSTPDVPFSRFDLKLFGGKKGLLENSKNLCKVDNRAKLNLAGQNGKDYDTEPKVSVSCPKHGTKPSSHNGKK